MKIKSKEIAEVREELLASQGGVCAICGLVPKVPCLDHLHAAPGYIRGVLCRPCNSMEGVVTRGAKRAAVVDLARFIDGFNTYLSTHSTDQTGLIHPSFKTKEEKLQAAKSRLARKRAKLKKSK